MRNIYFSELNDPNRWHLFLPYAWGLLRSYAESDDQIRKSFSWKEPFFVPQPIEQILNEIDAPDIFGFSCYVWNWNTQILFARKVKEKFPNCLIVFGGPSVPKDDANFFLKYPWIDILVQNEGEATFLEILKYRLSTDIKLSDISGISWESGGIRINNSKRQRIANLSKVRSPYSKGYYNQIINNLRSKGLRWSAMIETNRGCPYGCTYCDWGSATNSKIHLREIDLVLDEIEFLSKAGVYILSTTDANFGLFSRDLEIVNSIAQHKRDRGSPTYFYVQMAKAWTNYAYEISDALIDANLTFGVPLSLQSTNPETLKEIKRINIHVRDFKEIRKYARRKKVPVYTEVIVGLPCETKESLLGCLEELLYDDIEELRVYPLALLPNAEIALPQQREKHQFITKFIEIERLAVWGSGTKEEIEVVVATKTMSESNLIYCWNFVFAIQTFHINRWLKYISIYLDREHGISFKRFYMNLLQLPANENNYSLLKKINKNFSDLAKSQRTMGGHFNIEGRKTYLYPSGYASWVIEINRNEFYQEIEHLIFEIFAIKIPKDLIKFQSDIIVSHKYNSDVGTEFTYHHNWIDYFEAHEELKKCSLKVIYKDKNFSVDRVGFQAGDIFSWLRAVVGQSYRFRTMIHQPETRAMFLDSPNSDSRAFLKGSINAKELHKQ